MYAIMVCLDGKDDWIFVTERNEHCWDLKPLLFDDAQTALEYAQPWIKPGKEENVMVVSYDEQV